jgi:hypothetical protein
LTVTLTATSGPPGSVSFAANGTPFALTDAITAGVDGRIRPGGPGTCTATPTGSTASGPVSVLDGICYYLTVTNVSDVNVTDIQKTLSTPAGTSDEAGGFIGGSTALSAGATTIARREVSVNDGLASGSTITFTPQVTYDASAGTTNLNNETVVETPASIISTVAAPSFAIAQALADPAPAGVVDQGELVVSSIVVDNVGGSNATNARVEVDVANGQNITNVRIDGGPPITCQPAGPSTAVCTTTTSTNGTNNHLVVRIGAGASGTSGGTFAPAAAPITVAFDVTARTSPSGPPFELTSTAQVKADNASTATDTDTPLYTPDLAIAGVVSPVSPVVLDPNQASFTATYDVSNDGPGPESGIAVSLNRPAGAAGNPTATIGDGNDDGGAADWSCPDLTTSPIVCTFQGAGGPGAGDDGLLPRTGPGADVGTIDLLWTVNTTGTKNLNGTVSGASTDPNPTNNTATLTMVVNAAPGVLSVSDDSAGRRSDCDFVVTRSGNISDSTTVDYGISDPRRQVKGVLVEGQDALVEGTLQFAPGETTKTVTARMKHRKRTTVTAILSNPSNATIADDVGTCVSKAR